MNIALLFSYTKEILADRDRLRNRVEQLESEQKAFVDAIARNAGKPEVFNRPAPQPVSSVPPVAFGPTMSAQRQKAKEEEIINRAEEARAKSNGHNVEIPEIT
jgi:hypothetical protein